MSKTQTRRRHHLQPHRRTPVSLHLSKPGAKPTPPEAFVLGASLRTISYHLETLHALGSVIYTALYANGAACDLDATKVLARCVLAPLTVEIQRINRLIPPEVKGGDS